MRKVYYQITGMLVLAFLFTAPAYAQNPTTSTYLFFKPIYAFPANIGKIDENTAVVRGVTYTKGLYGSLGAGVCFQVGIGKMINNNFGFELAGEWVNGKKIKSKVDIDSIGNSLNAELSQHVNAFMIKPMLVLRNSGDLLSFYSKLGIAISVWSKGYGDVSIAASSAGQNFQLLNSEVDEIKVKIGYTAAFGISCRISQSFAITAELNGQMISLPVDKGHYTKYILNGADSLSTLKPNIKSWTYEKTISSASGDPEKPGTRLYEPINFSYIGLSIGIRYFF